MENSIKCEESDKLIDVLTKVSDGYYSKSAKILLL